MDLLKAIGIDKDKLNFSYLLKENRNLYRDINKLIKENEKLSDSEYIWMETSGYMEYLYKESEKENVDLKNQLAETNERNCKLKEEYNIELTDLALENDLLKEKNSKLDNLCFNITQENVAYKKENSILHEEIMSLENINHNLLEENKKIEKVNETLWEEHLKSNSEQLNLAGENFDLRTKIKRLEEENKQILNDKNEWVEKFGFVDSKIKEVKKENDILKETNTNISLNNTILEEKIEELTDQLEIKERLDTDKPLEEDYYNTKDLENNLLMNTIDKITDERNAYKEIIDIMCDKFEIPKDAVLDILDDIQISKGQQKEKTL